MIFSFVNPFILASEFVTHVTLIALVGIIVVEYVGRRALQYDVPLQKKRGFCVIALITALGALWVCMDYFGGFTIPFLFPLRSLLLFGIIALIVHLVRAAHTYPGTIHIPKIIGAWLIASIIIFLSFDTLYRMSGNPLAGFFYAIFRIIGVTLYYFFIMKYLVLNRHDDT